MTYTPRRQVSYYYDSDVGNFYYAQGHPMKPHRMRMTHNLLVAYGLFDKMDVLATPRASDRDMTRFHSDEYINFLKVITPDSLADQINSLSRFNVLEDCPVFDGLFEYCQIAAGGSLAGAARLNACESSIAINWAGGLHHAKKAEASGFCYINDCVLAILELLKVHPRVLYVDIDIHHGDGVEEAFYTTDRVMTASFHKFGDYFPGTGDVGDVGIGRGKHYSANFPLRDGINDESYREIFVPVMARIMDWYQPSAVVMQCGADSLSGDRLGCFNLSLFGHSQCVDFFKRYDVPLLLLGGGGYTVRNVARCWAYETSRAVDAPLSDELPFNENYEFYGPDFRLHISPSNMENHNTPEEVQKTKARIFENLRNLPFAPSTPFMDTPRGSPLGLHLRNHDSDNEDPDRRHKNHRRKTVIDYAGSDDEDDDQCISSLRRSSKRPKRLNFPPRRKISLIMPQSNVEKNFRIPSMGRDEYSPRRRGHNTTEVADPIRLTTASGPSMGNRGQGLASMPVKSKEDGRRGDDAKMETGITDSRDIDPVRRERQAGDGERNEITVDGRDKSAVAEMSRNGFGSGGRAGGIGQLVSSGEKADGGDAMDIDSKAEERLDGNDGVKHETDVESGGNKDGSDVGVDRSNRIELELGRVDINRENGIERQDGGLDVGNGESEKGGAMSDGKEVQKRSGNGSKANEGGRGESDGGTKERREQGGSENLADLAGGDRGDEGVGGVVGAGDAKSEASGQDADERLLSSMRYSTFQRSKSGGQRSGEKRGDSKEMGRAADGEKVTGDGIGSEGGMGDESGGAAGTEVKGGRVAEELGAECGFGEDAREVEVVGEGERMLYVPPAAATAESKHESGEGGG